MVLDEVLGKILKGFDEEGVPATSSLTVSEARRVSSEFMKRLAGPPVTLAGVRNISVPVPNAEVPVRVYLPKNESALPVLMYFHGGGWVIGDLDSVDWVCRSIAAATDCVVCSVDYRLAPEHKFPTAVEDCYWATRWVVKNASSLNVDPKRIAVGGDSAGGNLAIAVGLMSHDKGEPSLAHQMLICPITNHSFATQSYREYADGYYLTANDMKWFWNHYLADERDGRKPYASPLLAKDLSSQPRALIITAEFDPLRDEGEAYAKRLVEAGVPTKVSRYDGMVHCFLDFPMLRQTKMAINEIAAELRKTFQTDT